jgi:D-arabinose 1-dehydrogenase-like Zn-dependent alcohol dehydrogenase
VSGRTSEARGNEDRRHHTESGTFREFGGPKVLRVEEEPEPRPAPDQIRIVVRACGVNPG